MRKEELPLTPPIWLSVSNGNLIHKFKQTNSSIEPTFEKQRCDTQNWNISLNMSYHQFQHKLTVFDANRQSYFKDTSTKLHF